MPLTKGAFEGVDWPKHLGAYVVSGSRHQPRLQGYEVQSDLARYYSFAEVALASLIGEIPSESVAQAFNTALVFLAPVSITEAPAHAARLTQLIGGDAAGVVATTAVALAEASRFLVEEHLALLAALNDGDEQLPELFRTESEAQREAVKRLLTALPSDLMVSFLDQDPTLNAALICVLFACGLRHEQELVAILTTARLPCAIAEGIADPNPHFERYPTNTPEFHYEP